LEEKPKNKQKQGNSFLLRKMMIKQSYHFILQILERF
jgi:hypothetical protein